MSATASDERNGILSVGRADQPFPPRAPALRPRAGILPGPRRYPLVPKRQTGHASQRWGAASRSILPAGVGRGLESRRQRAPAALALAAHW